MGFVCLNQMHLYLTVIETNLVLPKSFIFLIKYLHSKIPESGNVDSTQALEYLYILTFFKCLTEHRIGYYQDLIDALFAETLTKLLSFLQAIQPHPVTLKQDVANIKDEPLFMLKSDVVKIVSNLSKNHAQFQDQFRMSGALPLVLNNCVIDDMNPFLRETCMFCIRNLLTGNLENQKFIASLKPQGVAKSSLLEELGVKPVLDGGKISFQ
jgi:hypothetical protein